MSDMLKERTMDATARAANPILKKERHCVVEASSSATAASATAPPIASLADGKSTPGKAKKHLAWDEHAIEEHDLLRGTRMKIDEPKTPYTEYEYHSDGESVSSGRHPRSPDESHPRNSDAPHLTTHWGDISSKLQAVADRREGLPSPTHSLNASDSEEEKKRAFKDMRKKHYNEAEEIKRWKAEHADDNDDDDGDESDDDDNDRTV